MTLFLKIKFDFITCEIFQGGKGLKDVFTLPGSLYIFFISILKNILFATKALQVVYCKSSFSQTRIRGKMLDSSSNNY